MPKAPKIVNRMPAAAPATAANAEPADEQHLRAYRFHGLDLRRKPGERQAAGDCPFCGREGKLTVEAATGLWRCFVCAAGSERGGGNLLTFLRLLWDESDKRTNGASKELAAARGLMFPETVTMWGVCQSIITKEWLMPGFAPDGKLCQLYRWVPDRKTGKMLLLATPGQPHGMHGVNLLNKDAEFIYVCEGWGDALALWEILRACRREGDDLATTGAPASSMLAGAAVVGVPGCSVFAEGWAGLFAGKHVTLCYDNDHPRGPNGARAGWDGAKRAAGILAAAKVPPKEIRVLQWGKDGHDPALPSGHDVRDALGKGATPAERLPNLKSLLAKVVPAPWVTEVRDGQAAVKRSGAAEIEPAPCDSWAVLLNAWQRALSWRQEMEDVLTAMLAVATSTDQAGDQLFLQVIGDAGSAKTRFCDAMLVSKRCHSLEHLTGFHSGWKGENGEDCSLIARINHKTLVTPEGDTMVASPNYAELMAQTRRIFDGTTGATYKNTSEDKRWTGLRTPWIIAGTPALLDMDQSRLGDRFLRVVINRPTDAEEDEILEQVFYAAMREVTQTSNCSAESTVEDAMLAAYKLTGGYVDHLREGMADLSASVEVASDKDAVKRAVVPLAKFAADMRARPAADPRKPDQNTTKELPSRLTKQFARLAVCAAVVQQRKEVDAGALRLVRKVALDTGRGKTMKVCKLLRGAEGDKRFANGVDARALAVWMHEPEEKTRAYLQFLAKIGVCESFQPKVGRALWRLTARTRKLWAAVVENNKENQT